MTPTYQVNYYTCTRGGPRNLYCAWHRIIIAIVVACRTFGCEFKKKYWWWWWWGGGGEDDDAYVNQSRIPYVSKAKDGNTQTDRHVSSKLNCIRFGSGPKKLLVQP